MRAFCRLLWSGSQFLTSRHSRQISAKDANARVEDAVVSVRLAEDREAVGDNAQQIIEKWVPSARANHDEAAYVRSSWASLTDRDSIDLSLILRHLLGAIVIDRGRVCHGPPQERRLCEV